MISGFDFSFISDHNELIQEGIIFRIDSSFLNGVSSFMTVKIGSTLYLAIEHVDSMTYILNFLIFCLTL